MFSLLSEYKGLLFLNKTLKQSKKKEKISVIEALQRERELEIKEMRELEEGHVSEEPVI